MKTNQDLLEPAPGFPREIGYYLGAWEKARAKTRELIEDLSKEEIARRFVPNMHSIGAITLHLGEAEFYWIQEVVAGKTPTEEEKKFAHLLDTMEADFDRGYTARYCIETIDKISGMTREMLKNFDDNDLEKIYLREYANARTELSLRSILQRLIDHEAHHRGQIAMIKRLVRGGETADK